MPEVPVQASQENEREEDPGMRDWLLRVILGPSRKLLKARFGSACPSCGNGTDLLVVYGPHTCTWLKAIWCRVLEDHVHWHCICGQRWISSPKWLEDQERR